MEKTQKRVVPPQLNRISAEDLQRMERDGLGRLYTPNRKEAERLEKVFGQVWSLFYGDFVKDGKLVLTALFTWDGDTSTGVFGPPNDGICCCWGDHAGIGVEKAAFLRDGDYMAFLLLHELAHIIRSGDEGEDHDTDFEDLLDYLLLQYNKTFGTHLQNDFAGYKGEHSLKRDQKRADSMTVPDSWAEIFKKTPSESAESRSTQKPKAADPGNSAQDTHRAAMIQRMQQQDKEPKTSKQVKIVKSYNGVRWEERLI